jgi:hypothetical protein
MTASAPDPENPNQPSTSRESALAEAVSIFVNCQARGEAVDVERFCREHADLLPELRVELQTIESIDSILGVRPALQETTGVEEALPERLSGHRVLGEIGSGGMGRVLLAEDERLDRKVAAGRVRFCLWQHPQTDEEFFGYRAAIFGGWYHTPAARPLPFAGCLACGPAFRGPAPDGGSSKLSCPNGHRRKAVPPPAITTK